MIDRIASRCKLLNIDGIDMIACPESGIIIGLTPEGHKLIKKLVVGWDLQKDKLTADNKALLQALQETHMLDEHWIKPHTLSAYFHVTPICNLSCVGCYSRFDHRNENCQFSFEQCCSIIDKLAEAGATAITVSGGEPFVRTDIIEILRYIKTKNIHITCITNGTAAYSKYEQALSVVDDLAFSLDGNSVLHSFIRKDVFPQVEKTIDLLLTNNANHAKMSIIFTLHHLNIDFFHEMKEYASSKGISNTFSIFTAEVNKETENYALQKDDFLKLSMLSTEDFPITIEGLASSLCYRQNCGAGKRIISVAANGDVFPCQMFYANEFKLGNVFTDKIDQLIENCSVIPNVDDVSSCSKCEYKYVCGGGCAFRRHLESNKGTSSMPSCVFSQAYYYQLFELLKNAARNEH